MVLQSVCHLSPGYTSLLLVGSFLPCSGLRSPKRRPSLLNLPVQTQWPDGGHLAARGLVTDTVLTGEQFLPGEPPSLFGAYLSSGSNR